MENIYLLLLFYSWIFGFCFAHFCFYIVGYFVYVDDCKELKLVLIVLYTLLFFGAFNWILLAF